MNENDIILESQICGSHKFNFSSCIEAKNCVFMNLHLNDLKNMLTYCFSYNEIMNHFIKVPERYLKENGIHNYNSITKSNFCDIIDESTNFLGYESHITFCKVSDF